MHIGLNRHLMVHDFYYPYVGLENHVAARGMHHRIGVYVDGRFSWLDDGSWRMTYGYPHDSLVAQSQAVNEELQISLEFDDAVDGSQAAFMRNIHVINAADRERTVKLFMHQVFLIGNSNNGDTAQYHPGLPAVIHYKGHRTFVAAGRHGDGSPFTQHSIGVYGIEGKEGTYKDAEDGLLSGNNVEHGSVDSVLGFELALKAHDSGRVEYWIAAGKSTREALVIHHRIEEEGVHGRLEHTQAHWDEWMKPALHCAKRLPRELQGPFIRSTLLTKAHIDKRGAVIASTDTTMLNYSRDAYGYCWPRDAVFVLWPLVRMGYKDEALQFFNFCKRVIHPDGYLMHKYQADGALGSSWHPFVHRGNIMSPPIQEDETAAVLFLIGQYLQLHPDIRYLHDLFPTLIKPMADFMCSYVDEETKLPKPSYDLWEEKFLTSTYTVAAVYAGLLAAVKLAETGGYGDDAVRWHSALNELKEAACKKLYDHDARYFIKGFLAQDEAVETDRTIDLSSFYGAFMFGLYDTDSPELQQAFETLKRTFSFSDDTPAGIPRYERDAYNLTDPGTLGNPWFITGLWIAQYHIERGDYISARRIIDWVVKHALPSGVLSEQINPHTGTFVSVAPLAWSQAELVNTLLDIATGMPQLADVDPAKEEASAA